MRYVHNMLGRLFLLFTLVPALEIYLLVQIGERLGGLATLALVIATGALGASLAKAEGLRVLRDWQTSLARGQVPADGVVSSALVLVGGVLLITPGVLTDMVGLMLLVPRIRRAAAAWLTHRLERSIASGSLHVVQTHQQTSERGGPAFDDSHVITVEGETVSQRAVPPEKRGEDA